MAEISLNLFCSVRGLAVSFDLDEADHVQKGVRVNDWTIRNCTRRLKSDSECNILQKHEVSKTFFPAMC